MLELLLVIGRALALALRDHRELSLANLALQQQLTALERTTKRPHLQAGDRLCWIGLARLWGNWRTAVVLVRPATVVRWHRDWLRRRWTAFAAPPGRPFADQPTDPNPRPRDGDGAYSTHRDHSFQRIVFTLKERGLARPVLTPRSTAVAARCRG